jgi:hypothetical protein
VLAQALTAHGVTTTPLDAHHIDVDTRVHGDVTFDLVRDAVADLGLRLYAVSTRHRSLDDVFLQEASR